MRGNVVGVITSKLSIAEIEGVGFALHITELKALLDKLPHGESRMLPTPTPRPTATPTPRPTSTPRPTATPQIRREFGPHNGELRHNPTNSRFESRYAGVSIADMVVESTFTNPYSSASNDWTYGFLFRLERPGHFFRVIVGSRGDWNLKSRTEAITSYDSIDSGTLGKFNTNAGGSNHLRIVAIETRGWFFVNDEFVSTLDLSAINGAGDVAAVTGVYKDDEQSGAVTRYEGFQGRELTKQYGPARGQLQNRLDGVSTHVSGVWTRDLVTEAEFTNPLGSNWDYGFIIRSPVPNRLDLIGINGSGQWFHFARDVGDDRYTDAAKGWLYSTGIDWRSRRNHLLLLGLWRLWLVLPKRPVGFQVGPVLQSGLRARQCDGRFLQGPRWFAEVRGLQRMGTVRLRFRPSDIRTAAFAE